MTPRVSWVCPPLQGFYPGGTAIAFRQMTNWASRQGFTEAVREQFKLRLHGSKSAKLSKAEEVGSGILGGETHALLPFLAAVNMPPELSFNVHTVMGAFWTASSCVRYFWLAQYNQPF